jgi:4-carboxymuconolactone decarboxylase
VTVAVQARFPDIADGPLSDEQRRVKERIVSGPRGQLVGPFRILLHAPRLESALHPVGEYLRYGASLPDDVREVVILATAVHWRCAFEWDAHAPIAKKAGVSDLELADLRRGALHPPSTPPRLTAHAVALTMHRTGSIPDALFDEAVAAFGREGVLEMLALCGYYSTLAMVLNTANPPEADAFPQNALIHRNHSCA